MTTFVDTSALLAALNSADEHHQRAGAALRILIESDEVLISTNYIVVETFAVAQRRLGMEAVHTLQRDFIPLLQVLWIDEESHDSSMAAFLTASRRRLSLVDCSSFEIMRRSGVRRAFAVDGHFEEHGFEQIP
ncbi:MAG TPA: PIN domain-containing protein [Thermoanaerobaculia bacterium]